jgi:hypothetical protein
VMVDTKGRLVGSMSDPQERGEVLRSRGWQRRSTCGLGRQDAGLGSEGEREIEQRGQKEGEEK